MAQDKPWEGTPKKGIDMKGFSSVQEAKPDQEKPKRPSPKPQKTPSVKGGPFDVNIPGVEPVANVEAPAPVTEDSMTWVGGDEPQQEWIGDNTPTLPAPSERPTTSERLSRGYLDDTNLENYMASNQGKWELIGKAATQTLSEAVLGTVEASSYLLDFEQMVNKLRGDEQEYTNWLAQSMKKAKGDVEEATHVYQTSEAQEGFAPSDATWWAKNTPQAIGTALSLMIPAAGIAGGAGKLGKLAGFSEGAINLMRGLSATTASRYAEATMEANNVYEQAYNELIAKDVPDQEARERAGKAASQTWNTNWVFAAQDLLQYSGMLKGFQSAAKGKIGRSIGEFFSSTVTEGAEEAGQFIVSEEAKQAALDANSGYFSKGFSRRLSDYVNDPEFKSSVLLGAVGGAVFSTAAPLGRAIAGATEKIFKRGVIKEAARYKGDTATVTGMNDQDFAQSVSDHMEKGTLPVLRRDIEELSKTSDLPAEVHTTLKRRVDNLNFIIDEQARLKSDPTIPESAYRDIIFTKLDQRDQSQLHDQIKGELDKLKQEAVDNKELPGALLPIKEAQLTAIAFTELAKDRPELKKKADTAVAMFESQIAQNPELAKQLVTSTDAQMNEKAIQLASVNETIAGLKNELISLTTPQGIDNAKKKEDARKAAQDAAAFVANNDVTVAQLKQYLKDRNPQGQAQNIIMEKLQQKAAEVKTGNQMDVFAALVGQAPTKTQTEPVDLDPDQQIDAALESLDDPEMYEPVPYEPEPYEPSPDDLPESEKIPIDLSKAVKQKPTEVEDRVITEESPTVEQKAQEEVQVKAVEAVEAAYKNETVAGYLKMLSGKWEEGVFITDTDEFGVPIKQEWHGPDGPIDVTKIFETDDHGHLLIDTPLLQPGMPVLLRVVDDGTTQSFPYTLTPEYRADPTKKDGWAINVYLVDKDGNPNEKPIMQLPSGDNKARSHEAAKLRALRAKVTDSPTKTFQTIIGDTNSIGEFIRTNRVKSLDILKFDYFRNNLGNWQYGNTGINPILSQVGAGRQVIVPNVDGMNGMTTNTLERIESFIDRKDITNLSVGATYILRTNRKGNFQAALALTRRVNEAEAKWLHDNLSRLLQEGNIDQIREIINLKRYGAGIYSTKNGVKNKELIDMMYNQFSKMHFVQTKTETGKKEVAGELLVPFTRGQQKFWLIVRATGQGQQLQSMLDRGEFWFHLMNNKGEREYFHIDNIEDPREKDDIYNSIDNTIKGSYKNVSAKLINSEIPYTDPATNRNYNSYYDYIVATDTLLTDLPGSKVMGGESSYSFHNARVGITVTPEPVKIEKKAEEVVPPADITTPPVEPPTETKPAETGDLTEEGFKNLWESYDESGEQLRPFQHNPIYSVIGNQELAWFKDAFGEEGLVVAKGVDRVYSRGGQEAFGIYHNALVTLADFAEEGTLYHEAFHFAMDLQATPKEKERVLSGSDEETRAEEFRDYMLSNGLIKPKEKPVQGFFNRLWTMIKNLLGMRGPVEQLFKKIATTQLDEATRTRYAEARKNNKRWSAIDEKPRLLPKFPTYVAMNQAVSAASYEVLEIARAISKSKGTDIFSVLSNDNQLNSIFEKVRSKYNDDLNRIKSIPTKERTREDMLRYGTYLAMGIPTEVTEEEKKLLGSWEGDNTAFGVRGFKFEVVKSFRKFGFQVKQQAEVDENDEELEVDEGQSETSKEHIFDLDHTLVSPAKSLSTNIKLFLSEIPEPTLVNDKIKLDEQGNPVIKKTILGTPIMIDFNRVYNNLKIKLVGSPNPIERLGELAQLDPISRVVYDALTKEVAQGNTQLFQEFNTNMNLANYHQVTPLYGRTEEGEDTARLVATNRSSAASVIKDKTWKNEAIRKSFIDMQGVVNHDKAVALRKQLKAVEGQEDYEELVKAFKHVLKEIGVVLPDQIFEKMASDKPEKRMSTIKRWMFGEKGNSLENFLAIGISGADPFGQTTILNTLARLTRDYVDNRSGDTHLNEKMKQVNPINTPSYITEFIDDINQDYARAKAKQEFYRQDSFYTRNKFVDTFTNKLAAGDVELDFISASREQNRDAKDFGERGPSDSFIIRFVSYFNNSETSTTGKYFVQTFSDKTKQAILSLPKHKGTNAHNFLIDVLTQTTKNEVARIQRNKRINEQVRQGVPLPADIKPYNNRGNQFLYVTEANNIAGLADSLTGGELSTADLTKVNTELRKVITDHITTQYELFEQNLVDNGVINRGPDDSLTNNRIPATIVKSETELRPFLKEFFYNDYAWRTEVSKVIAGDKAFYKSDDDYNKRMYQLVTPGLKPYSDPTAPVVLTRIVYPSVKKTPVEGWIASIKALFPKGRDTSVVDNYDSGKVNATDAQSLSTVHAYRSIAQAMGRWTGQHELVYQKAWKANLTVNQAIDKYGYTPEESAELRKAVNSITLQPLKPFQYNDRTLRYEDDTIIIKEQFKDSIFPITPELTVRHQEYKRLLDYMIENKADIASAEDTVKVGSYGVIKWDTPVQAWQRRRVNLRDMRIPQILPDVHKTEILGSQYWKLIDADIEYEQDYVVNGKIIKGEELVTLFQKYKTQKLEEKSAALRKEIGLGDSFTLSDDVKERGLQLVKIKNILDNELLSRDLNENYEDAIQLVLDEMGKPNFTVHLGFPTHARKFESVLLNLFKKRVLRSKSPGESMVNFADFNISGKQSASNLNFITNQDGKVVEAEIGMPISFFKQIGLDVIQHIDPATGKLRWESLSPNQKRALQMIVYRIPTSNKSSMLPVRVAMVVPHSSGNVVMVPGEITTQQGLDFDVDKSNILRRELTDDGKVDESNVDTKLFDLSWAVLTSNEHIAEMLTPLAAPELVRLKEKYQGLGIVSGASKYPVTTTTADVATEDRNKDSKAMIGIISRFNTAHSLLQKMAKAHLISVGAYINILSNDNEKYGYNQFGRKFDSRGNLISNNYAQLQHQSLDNPKDPILSDLNIYTVTMPLAGLFTEMGVPLEVLTDFMMQPIIREWIQQYKVDGVRNIEKSYRAILDKYPKIAERIAVLEDSNIDVALTEDMLKQGLTQSIESNIAMQAQVFKDFKDYMTAAGVASRISNVLSVDTFSGMTDIETIETFSDTVKKVTDPEALISLSPAVFSVKDAPAEIKSVSAFYTYGVLDAIKFTGQFFPYMNQAYAISKEELADQVGQDSITDVDTLKKYNSFLDFFLLESNNVLRTALEQISPKFYTRWQFSPGQSGLSIWEYVENVVNANPILRSNPLIQALENYPNKDLSKVQAIGVSNTNKADNKSRLTQGWRDMLFSNNPAVKNLAGDLVRYAIYGSGFGYTTKSFVDLIPIDFWTKSGLGRAHENMVKGLTPLDIEGNNATRISTGAPVTFIRNKFEELDIVPEVYPKSLTMARREKTDDKSKSTHILEFSLPGDHRIIRGEKFTKWLKIYDKTARKMRLYESSPTDPYKFKEVQPLGEGRVFTEISTSGRDSSELAPNNEEGLSPNPFAQGSLPNFFDDSQKGGNNEHVAYYLPLDKNTPETILKKLIETETDPIGIKMVNKMLQNVAKLKNIPIVRLSSTPLTVREDARWLNRAGELSLSSDQNGKLIATIIINDSAPFTEAGIRHTLIHELIHVYTIGMLDNPTSELEFELEKAAADLSEEIFRKKKAGKIAELPYAVTDAHEMVAELASNPKTREMVTEDPSIWRRIVRFFRKLFGFPEAERRTVNDFMEILFKAIDSRQNTLTGSEFRAGKRGMALETKDVIKGKKSVHIFDEILSSLDAQRSRLLNRGFKDKARGVKRTIEKLEKVRDTNIAAFVNRYLIRVTNELRSITEAVDTLEAAKDPSKISPKVLEGIREQLTSYDLLRTLRDQIRRFPEDYGSTMMGDNLEEFGKLIGEILTLESRLKDLRLTRAAWRTKSVINTPETEEEIRNNYQVGERDISWANYELDPGMDVPDTALQAIHKMLKDAFAKGQRTIYEFLNSNEDRREEAVYRHPEDFLDPYTGEFRTFYKPLKYTYTKRSGITVLDNYERWLKTQGINSDSITDKFKPVLNTSTLHKDSSGVEFIAPNSKEGRRILSLSEDNPLRQFYENFVLGYLGSQKALPEHLRPGLRIPSIGRGLLEAWMRENGKDKIKVFGEQAMNDLRRRYDELDYKPVDETGEPQNYIPVRFISLQDGKDGHLSTREVSLDIANSVVVFMDEMATREELDKVVPDTEIIKSLLGEREVVDESRKQPGKGLTPFLMRKGLAATSKRGKLQTKRGTDTNSFKMAERILKRLAYGQYKKDEGTFTIFGQQIEVRKFTDAFLKYTGLRIMLGNIAIPLTNLGMGNLALWKEAVGGNLVNKREVATGNRFYLSVLPEAIRDLNNRQKQTKFGKFWAYMNPMDHSRPNNHLGIDSTWMRRVWTNITTSSPVEFQLATTTMGAVASRFKGQNKEGKDVSFYDAVEVSNDGKMKLLDGYTYKGKSTLESADIDEVRDYTLRLYEYMNGIYNTLDSPGMKESSVGTLVLFMRNWLRPGFRTRWELKRYDPRLKQNVEGHYISALIAFNNMYNPETGWMASTANALKLLIPFTETDPNLLLLPDELDLPQEEKNTLINMRKSNIRKTLFELYLIAGLSVLIFAGLGGDDDSYAQMMLARMRREALTFLSPTTAWDVLRSPTVALRSIEDINKTIWSVVDAPIDLMINGEVEVYERGKHAGEMKWKADVKSQIPIINQMKQFDDLSTQTRLIIQGQR